MEDGSFDEKFANSILLESLKEALKQMIDEFYVEKEIGIKIYKEACMNMKKEILENSSQLSDVNIGGQLKSYYCRNDVWTFFFKNSLFKITKNKKPKNTSKDYKNYQPLNLRVYKNFYDKKEKFLKDCIDNNNVKFFKNFGKLYARIVHNENNENDTDDTFFYYDGLIKILCVEDSLI
ncbi:transcription initiation factor IIA subunit 2 [Plasmodium brasilianum]|uniref:Transcription initiation factor IIA subunit 2 n=2 Tax=Plasmodium (Plasmodium) TaxID=418103 RepID=A0A1A8WEU8_PLAMA|nr:conserved Plasmodium protein, unknown function [Plasmodium malariae]KAI4835194.1 transcription initiation factor IIA subunit 2 [Plasmodium brasilianum]SBS91465.1 conserved Plasmodium protein, unknown function [Plasmodium malariae]SCP03778.1 conserved Plasmodium protein, unknown function [Plasmodium malariae]